MNGVPVNLDLSKFKGTTLIQLGISEYQIQFHFHPSLIISVEGKWELHDLAGILIDDGARDSITKQEALHLHMILGKSVQSYLVSAPDSFSLQFNSGHVLTIFDDSKQHESFSIEDIYI
jgi:hypothetical protein